MTVSCATWDTFHRFAASSRTLLRYVQSISHVWLQTHESADKLRIQHYGSLLERRHDVQHAYAPRRTILGDLVLAPWLVHVPNSRYVFPSPSYLFPTPFVALDLTVTCQVQASRKLSAHFRRAEECTYSFFTTSFRPRLGAISGALLEQPRSASLRSIPRTGRPRHNE